MMVLLMLEQYRERVWYNTLTPSDLVTIALLVIVFGINRFIDLEYRVYTYGDCRRYYFELLCIT